MNRKVIRHSICALFTLVLCLHTIFSLGTNDLTVTAEAATKVTFASSIKSSAKKAATKAGADSDTEIGVTNVKNYISVYSKRSSSSTLKGRLYRGTGVYVIKTKGNWSYISSGSLKGWVKSKYIATGSKAKTVYKEINPRVATVTASDLNVRSSKSTSSDDNIILNVEKGTQLIVLGTNSKWVKVRLTNDTTGYVYKKYVSIEKGLYTGITKSAETKRKNAIEEMKETVASETSSNSSSSSSSGEWVSLGTFKITAYCGCSKCCGSSCTGKTASGATPKANYTIAVDKSVISLGTKVKLGDSDTVYVAQDTGGAIKGNKIDVYFDTHSAALNFGVKYMEVYVYQE
ncbi:MAG: SH3 domain-containing protein [Lachnospiraceae bacterium]|nr:SH3 domain-containing protein [Lachnospiraceae bacterium]